MERRVTTRKRPLRSLLFVFAALLLLGAGAMAAINLHMIASVRDRILTSEQAAALDVDCILVLGAGLRATAARARFSPTAWTMRSRCMRAASPTGCS